MANQHGTPCTCRLPDWDFCLLWVPSYQGVLPTAIPQISVFCLSSWGSVFLAFETSPGLEHCPPNGHRECLSFLLLWHPRDIKARN